MRLGESPGARLRDDERGAMMIMGIFMTTLVVAMLYYVAGVGEAITYRERMMDAADTGALGGALMYARAMNVVVLMNLMIATVLGVYVGVRVADEVLLTAAAAASSRCRWYRPRPCWIALCLTIAQFGHCNRIRRAERIAEQVSQAARNASRVLARGVGAAATARAALDTTDHYDPPVNLGIGIGGTPVTQGFPLPIEDDRGTRICRDAAPWPWQNLDVHLVIADIARQEANTTGRRCSGRRRYINEAMASVGLWIPLQCSARRDIRPPQRVWPRARLGDDNFQFRVAVTGEAPFDTHTTRVERVATWGEGDGDSGATDAILDLLTDAGTLGVSQAEFYYDDDDDGDEWMWELEWRARLRRVRIPAALCGNLGVGGGICGSLNRLVVH
ncbi:MAG: hypothetical protein AAF447_08045 [Myxococcota bacterium]